MATSSEKRAQQEFFSRHNGEDLKWPGSNVHKYDSEDYDPIKYIPFSISGSRDIQYLMSEEDLKRHIRYSFPDEILVPQGSILQEFRYKIFIDSVTREYGETRDRWDDVMAFHYRVEYRVVRSKTKLVDIDEHGNHIQEY